MKKEQIPSLNREKRSLELRDAVYYVLGIAILFITTLFYIYPSVETVTLYYKMGHLKKEKKVVAELNRQLRRETALLRSPERIESIAIEKLGMIYPTDGQIILVGRE